MKSTNLIVKMDIVQKMYIVLKDAWNRMSRAVERTKFEFLIILFVFLVAQTT